MKVLKTTVLLFIMMTLLVSCLGSSSTKALFSAIDENAGLDEIVKQINRGADVNATHDSGMKPLTYAMSRNMKNDIILALIEAGADVNAADSFGNTPIEYIAENPMIVEALIEAGADVTKLGENYKQVMLVNAIDSSSLKTIAALIGSGVDVNKQYKDIGRTIDSRKEWTPLDYAVRSEASTEVIKTLIEAGADINQEKIVYYVRNLETLNIIIDSGFNVNQGYPLKALLINETTTKEMVAAMIEAGADVNLGTPLEYVRNVEVLKLLIEAGANVNIEKPLVSLLGKDTTTSEMVAAMIEAGADVNLGNPLMVAIKKKRDPGIIITLIGAGANVNKGDQNEGTLLTMALRNELADEIIYALIDAGADANGKPLFLAVRQEDRNLKLISALIKAGADVNAKNFAGWRSNPIGESGWGWDVREMTPLMSAIEADASLEIIATLIESGARVNDVDSRGWSPLVYAASSITNPRVISLLIEHGAAVNHVYTWDWSSKGLTPLMFAAIRSRTPDVVDALLDEGADAKIVVNRKKAIDYAKENEYLVGTPVFKRLESLSL